MLPIDTSLHAAPVKPRAVNLRKRIVGIDLGTSYSSISILTKRQTAVPVRNAEGQFATPSVVFFGGRRVEVGEAAARYAAESPERAVRSAKRNIGRDVVYEVGGGVYTPVDIAAFVLRKLRKDLEETRGPIDKAVITVPAHFNGLQRELTLEAARQAGIEVLDLINEPAAAALCYVFGEEGLAYRELAGRQTLLVYDLGGGTFDLSLADYEDGRVRVLAANGDLRLGGIDWNERIIEDVATRYFDQFGTDVRGSPKLLERLATQVELAKCRLSEKGVKSTRLAFGRQSDQIEFEYTLTRERFGELTRHLLMRTRDLMCRLVENSSLDWNEINLVLPVGGATRMPMVRSMVRELVSEVNVGTLRESGESTAIGDYQKPAMQVFHLPPKLSVSQGAALFAGMRTSRGGDRLAGFQHVEMATSDLGVIVRDAAGQCVNHVVLKRGSRLPATASVVVKTWRHGQRRLMIHVTETSGDDEGRGRTACDCIIDDLPPDLAAGSLFDVDLTCQDNGLLHVVATHRDSGLRSSVTVTPRHDPSAT